jgi:hypothetical protein
MPPEEQNFQTFFATRVKDRNMSFRKLSELTGIAPAHLENMMAGRFDELPSAPYVHGYLMRLGKVLDFDGEAWWERLKKERLVTHSGPADALPNNRFLRPSPTKFIWIGAVAVLVIIYLGFQLPIIFGKPSVAILFPTSSPYSTASSTFTFSGVARGTDSLSLNGDPITIASDGTWQKSVLLQDGVNTFQIQAKRVLGGETDITEEVMYTGGPLEVGGATGSAGANSSSSSQNGSTTASSTASGTSATPSIP